MKLKSYIKLWTHCNEIAYSSNMYFPRKIKLGTVSLVTLSPRYLTNSLVIFLKKHISPITQTICVHPCVLLLLARGLVFPSGYNFWYFLMCTKAHSLECVMWYSMPTWYTCPLSRAPATNTVQEHCTTGTYWHGLLLTNHALSRHNWSLCILCQRKP